MAKLWLTVYEQHDGPGYGFPSELWWKDMALEGTPDVSDSLFFLRSDEDPEGSVETEVKSRYWGIDGTLNIELRSIVHLPNEQMEKDINSRVRLHLGDEHFARRVPMPWRTYDDEYGILDERLVDSGWQRYIPRAGQG